MPLSRLVVLEESVFGNTQEGVRPIVTALAAQTLSGGRLVAVDEGGAHLVSCDAPDLIHAVTGLTLGAASLGAPVEVQTGGRITDSAFAFTAGEPVFLGLNGLPTQTPPSTGFLLRIGYAESPTTLVLRLCEPIQFS